MQCETTCENCFWFMLVDTTRKCCYAASNNHDQTDPQSTCKYWRDKRKQSQRLRVVDDNQCGF